MDVKAYFQKIRSVEQSLGQGDAIVVSLDTNDGGRAGRAMELSRELAAKMIVDGRVRMASAEEAERHRAETKGEREEWAARSSSPREHFLIDIAERKSAKGKR
ncbi:MAG: hypothetical protein SFV18_19530 [Bryobacteraceae bacterium]|nr:hypothetical protein [Bryobacteraceae bacterium]